MSNRLSFFLPFAVIALAFAGVAPAIASAQGTQIVNIESTPAGATVYVDSTETTPLGTTPMRRVRAPKGSHTLIFRLAGHRDAQLPVNVRKWNETFRATLAPFGRIVVTAGNASAQGATVTVDGQPVGAVPLESNVEPGRHLVVIERTGFVSYQQWMDVAGGQVLTIPVLLERAAPDVGSILVASDVAGARVTVDGEPKGTTPIVVEGLAEGAHVVEVSADGADLSTHRETVQIRAGERVTVRAVLRVAAVTGTLRVISNAPGAVISVDGDVVGNAPVTVDNLTVGEHIVQATAPDFESAAQTITIEAGRQRVLNMQLTQAARRPGRLIVNTNVAGARIFVDGRDVGAPPAILDETTAGTHAVVVRAEGYEELRTTCAVSPGEDCVVDASLVAKGTPIRVEANVETAELYFDGELVGPIPWEGMLPVGSHLMEVRAPGYRSHGEQVSLRLSPELRVFTARLVGENELTPAEERALERERQMNIHQAVSHSATVLPEDLALMDISAGWPYLGELRLGVGLHKFVDAGVAFRTFGILNEFEVRVKSGYRVLPYLSVGGQIRLGGGIGPSRDVTVGSGASAVTTDHPTNSFFFSLEAMATLHFARAGAFTFFAALDTHSDRWDWSGSDRDLLVSDSRQGLARGRFGGTLEFTLSKRLNLWGTFEGTAGKDRRILGDIFGVESITGNDPNMYGRLGVTLKFGTIWEEEQIESYDDVPLESGMTSAGGSYDVEPAAEAPVADAAPAAEAPAAPAAEAPAPAPAP